MVWEEKVSLVDPLGGVQLTPLAHQTFLGMFRIVGEFLDFSSLNDDFLGSWPLIATFLCWLHT